MSLLRRREEDASSTRDRSDVEPAPVALDADDLALRDEIDPDPLVEEAVERLRAALSVLTARDEWGRSLAWRQVARIAIGPLVTQLRDVQTASTLLEVTRPDPTAVPQQDRTEIGSGWPGSTLFLEG